MTWWGRLAGVIGGPSRAVRAAGDAEVLVRVADLADALASHDALARTRDDAVAGRQRAEEGERRAVEQAGVLRAELDRHRVAGDRVVDRLARILGTGLDSDVQAWWSVRGDAPAAGRAPVDEILTVTLPRATPVRVPTTDGGTTVIGAGRLADRPGLDARWDESTESWAAPTDGQAPADERDRELAFLRKHAETLQDGMERAWSVIPAGTEGEDDSLAAHIVAALAAAAPADDTAAPDGPTADEAVASAARIVEAWAHLRMDTPEDQATHDELVRVSRATIAAYVRTRPWSSAGQPVRDSQPEATAAPDPIETAARQLYAAIVAEHQRGETFPMRVSVCTNGLREALGETYPDDAAARPVRDGGEPT